MANATTNPNKNFQDVADKAKDAAGSIGDKAKDLAGTVGDKAKDLAGTVGDKAKDMVHSAGDRATDMGKSAVHMADNATAKVGHSFQDAADKIRDKGPHDGMMGNASRHVADTLERGGRYLQEEGVSGMANDVTDLIKRNPIPALLIGIGVGYLIGRALRS